MTNYFLMSLAVADLLVCMIVMPFGAMVFFVGIQQYLEQYTHRIILLTVQARGPWTSSGVCSTKPVMSLPAPYPSSTSCSSL